MVEQQNKIMEQRKTQHRDTFSQKKDLHNRGNSVSCDTPSSSCADVAQDLVIGTSSSMQTLRRILEIEELRQFSEKLDQKL